MNSITDTGLLPLWQGESPLRCIGRHEETPDSATFVLASDQPVRFAYRPGQFILVNVEIDGKKHCRAYSLCSSPSRPDKLAITVKRVPGGLVSNWLLDHLQPGQLVAAGAPAGEFYLQTEAVPQEVVLLSSGCGITPMLSMSQWLLDNGGRTTIRFIHSARDLENVIFREELLSLASRYENFHLELVLSRGGPNPSRLTQARLAELVPNVQGAQAYLCGPQEYMDQSADWLQQMGFPADQIFKEDFSPAAAQSCAVTDAYFQLEVPKFGKNTTISEGETLLDALEREGLPIIGACRTGVCGACKCKVTSGQVTSTSESSLTPDEIAAGYVLACSTRAKSDLSVEL
ncbi:NADH oxidoreductase Hcr [Formivibrio citricus]|uniref:NADH oxidoreductase Hcr n=1 Tax=Formivibrio citricus TaxID=83765 RepID=A0A1I5A642_9NEIS|nr:hybrid-cluster NAD(P)-dependent oxidoreductase [Formivibrio citricus]SFN57876.1 NADH oxidoreductase Hcr [Formivibrio citricus]